MKIDNVRVVGTCSLCGGPVVLPTIIHSTISLSPQCQICNATMKVDHGPVIPMVPPPPTQLPYIKKLNDPNFPPTRPSEWTCHNPDGTEYLCESRTIQDHTNVNMEPQHDE